jgi:hypothetical protein
MIANFSLIFITAESSPIPARSRPSFTFVKPEFLSNLERLY